MSQIVTDVLTITPDPRQLGGKPGTLTLDEVDTKKVKTDQITEYLTTSIDLQNGRLNVSIGGATLGAPLGVATLDATGKIPIAQIPAGVGGGLDVHASVRARTVVALPAYVAAGAGVGKTITSAVFSTLPAIDGVTLVVGNRLLL